MMRDYQKELADSLDKSDQIWKLEAINDSLRADLLTLARRLVFENESTFSPETFYVVNKWRDAALGGME